MTVITKPLCENKAKKLKEPLFPDKIVDAVPKVDVESGVEPRFVILGARAQRVSAATTVCLFLTALLVMSIGIIGGMYLYRQFARSQMHFHGWCTIPYNVHPNKQARPESLVSDSDFDTFGYVKSNIELNPDAETFTTRNSFKQEFEIDLENESFEKINVPDFGKGRRGRFIHDFSANKTGIIDLKGRRCFVMPLDRAKVLPPQSMYDLFEKMSRGYYEVDTEIVRETMKVVTPPITDFKAIGQYIAEECKTLKTYLLERDDGDRISKRSVPSRSSEAVFAEFTGKKISELYIDTSALDEYEDRGAPQV